MDWLGHWPRLSGAAQHLRIQDRAVVGHHRRGLVYGAVAVRPGAPGRTAVVAGRRARGDYMRLRWLTAALALLMTGCGAAASAPSGGTSTTANAKPAAVVPDALKLQLNWLKGGQ